MGAMAVAAARAVGYVSAGTVEFLVDPHGDFCFLEMNTRIQVEHPVTELVTGIDLVRAQIGSPPARRCRSPGRRRVAGHAFECRINAEDAGAGFLPAPGRVVRYPSRPGPACASTRASRRAARSSALRPDDRQAVRLGQRPRARAPAHAARARRARGRGRADARPAAPADPAAPVLHRRRDVRGPDRGRARRRARAGGAGRAGAPGRPSSGATRSRSTARRYDVGVALPADELLAAERRRRAERRARGSARAGGRRARRRARCRAPCCASRSPRATRSRPARCS